MNVVTYPDADSLNAMWRNRNTWETLSRFFGARFAHRLTTVEVCHTAEWTRMEFRTPREGRVTVLTGWIHSAPTETVDIFVTPAGSDEVWHGEGIFEIHNGTAVPAEVEWMRQERADLREWLAERRN